MIALVCVAVLVLRIGGAHLHLCFDGSEPPVAMHLGDSGVHHADEAAGLESGSNEHADRDIGIGADALVKKPTGSIEIPLLAVLFGLLLFYVARRRDVLPVYLPPFLLTPARAHLRPPLRGPPRPA
jgi:hypothetical protein